MNLLLPSLAPVFMSPQRLTAGLEQLVEYLHRNRGEASTGYRLMPRRKMSSACST
jgi:hypothetical protein